MGIFIQVDFDPSLCGPDGGRRLVDVCPVNIFVDAGQGLRVDSEMEDECTLCGLCLAGYEAGAVRVRRLYAQAGRETF